ncbi:helix-turn-helix transcriptional regulator [Micromonospora tulbaghiae]|uniref:helix-turn-helix transcriptional regulator n=1 Tax=Micromonospora tulbaghiae TaxID=479978 RepID=UPI003EBDAB87
MPAVHDTGTTTAPAASVHIGAITQAVTSMRRHLDEPHRLHDIARASLMSPFHFHRVFRMLTAVTPGRFLTAVRMAEAKRRLLRSDASATDISMAVGYSSFGTFTTQFTRLVGVSPGRFRTYGRAVADVPLRELVSTRPARPARQPFALLHVGARPDGHPGLTVVATFRSGIPQQRPSSCAAILSPGVFPLPLDVAGKAGVLAVSARIDVTIGEVLTEEPSAGICVGSAEIPDEPVAAQATVAAGIPLRRPALLDPPLLLAFPLLMIDAQAGPRRAQVR